MFAELEKYKIHQDQSIKVTEINIDLPSGEWISGKWWGDLSKKPILCLHGWMDNAGTFDRLIPLLPKEFSYLAIDLPGHGRSSWFPSGMMYNTNDFVLYILKVMREYNLETISLLSHSMGAGASFLFTTLFPEKVDSMILIDYNKNLDRTIEEEIKGARNNFLSFLVSDQRNQFKNEPPAYTIDEMIDRVYEGSLGNVYKESAPYLLERNIQRSKKYPEKFYFSRDSRLKSMILVTYPEDSALYAASQFRCPLLFLSSPHSVLYAKNSYFDKFIEVSKKNNPKFIYEVIDSDNHYFHINEPEKISQICEEIKIPLPYGGHISGKWWGDKSIQPFICLHGFLDNAGTFDRLIPLLPREFSYLAIDLPGHGKSSWLPDGVLYHTFAFIPILTIMMNKFSWKKISIIGHSLGTNIAFIFTSIFPEKVDMLISIEGFKSLKRERPFLMKFLKASVDKFLIADERNRNGEEPPAYTIDEITELLIKGTHGSVTKETAKYLYERNIKPSVKHPGKFFFSRDNRMKLNLDVGLSHDITLDLLKTIKIPFLFVKASNTYLYEKRVYYEEGLEVIKESPLFEHFVVESNSHHLHLTEPEKIAPKISEFIRKYKSKLSHL